MTATFTTSLDRRHTATLADLTEAEFAEAAAAWDEGHPHGFRNIPALDEILEAGRKARFLAARLLATAAAMAA